MAEVKGLLKFRGLGLTRIETCWERFQIGRVAGLDVRVSVGVDRAGERTGQFRLGTDTLL